MIRAMAQRYKGGSSKCYDAQGGGKICAPERAWSVFFATGNKRYGSGFETKAVPKHVKETLDLIYDWYVEGKRWKSSITLS